MTEAAEEHGLEGRSSRVRSIAALSLIILACLGVIISVVGLWLRSTLLDTESFMEVVDPVLASEEVVDVLGTALAEQVVTAVDIEGRVEARLAAIDAFLLESLADTLDLSTAAQAVLFYADLPLLADLSSSIATPIEDKVGDAIKSLVASDGFQQNLPEAVEFAHQGAVALIREDIDDLENVSIVNGEVRWNVLPAIATALAHVIDDGLLDSVLGPIQVVQTTYGMPQQEAIAQLGETLGSDLPDDFGEITIMSEERLAGWQSVARQLERFAVLAIVVTIVLIIVGMVVSGDKRRTLVQFAVGSIIAFLVVGIIQSNVLEAVDEAIPGPPEQAAADVLFAAVFANLRNVAWIFVAIAGVVGISAHLAGHPGWLRDLRDGRESDSGFGGWLNQLDDAITRHSDAFFSGGIAVALLVWWRVGLSVPSVLTVGVLLGGYLWYVARLIAGEPQQPEGLEI